MEVHILGSIGTGWGSYVKNLLGSKADEVQYTFPKNWLSYWQFKNDGINGKGCSSFTVPASTILRKVHLIRNGDKDFPKLEIVRVRADLIHSNCRFLGTSTPYVLVFDTPWLLTTFRSYVDTPSFGWIGRLITKQFALGNCAKVLPFSEVAKAEFIRMTGIKDDERKIEVLPPGIAMPEKTKSSNKRDDNTSFRLLFVGRNFDRKGGPILLKAFETLAADFANLRLTIKTRSKNIIVPPKIRDRVDVISTEIPKEELVSMYLNADLFVLPSNREAFGLACIEAMSFGLPVVASNHYALPEIVEDGVTGLLFETGSVEDLSRRIRNFLRDPELADKLGAAGLERARRRFSNEVVNSRLFQVYKDSLD